MTDREKVIKGLEHCSSGEGCKGCPYNKTESGHACLFDCVRDALALLREQEAVTEYVMDEYQPTCKACGFRPFAGYIPSLEWMRERGFKFCPQCGKAVKWNDYP